ncbi:MAG: ornithine carbamoyltransferase [Firmicutes bacterium]|nr:ornithine carbamoyltransferase [Bacillota bacterium]
MKKFNQKHLLNLLDYSKNEIDEILKLSAILKQELKKGKKHHHLLDKTVALIFAKSSTRTRVSFEQGVRQLGATPLFLSSSDIQLGRGETIHDTVKTLQRYNIDGIMIRTFKQSDVEELAIHGSIPIINGLTDDFHPCQALADIFTVYEKFGRLEGLKIAYFGDGNNVASSLMIAGAKMGMEVVVCGPKANAPNADILKKVQSFGKVSATDNIDEAVKNASIIYTDVFFSMGQEKDAKKEKELMPYQVNAALMKKANKDAVFMHCLPAHREEEVTGEIIDGKQSVVFDQAENRLHVQKAVMSLLMG